MIQYINFLSVIVLYQALLLKNASDQLDKNTETVDVMCDIIHQLIAVSESADQGEVW